MKVNLEDSIDLGITMDALALGAISTDDVSAWASRVIDVMDDPPTYIYTMLDLQGLYGKDLQREIGFVAGADLDDAEFQYLREIGVRRGLEQFEYLAGKKPVTLNAMRKARLDELLRRNFGIDPDALPPLSDFRAERSSH
jgi:hypothetical protein